jgi:hypothetical protein
MTVKNKICKCGCGQSGKIWSKGMLKQCFFRLNPTKPIKKSYLSKKPTEKALLAKEKKKEYTIEQTKMFLDIWKNNPHNCKSCDKYLGEEPLSLYFDHLIEKSQRRDIALCKWNIYICCGDCHSKKTNGYPTLPHAQAIEQAKLYDKFLKDTNAT